MEWCFLNNINNVLQILDILAHILDPSKEMESKVCLLSLSYNFTFNPFSFSLNYFSIRSSSMKDR